MKKYSYDPGLPFEEPNGFKRLIKRGIRKSVRFLLKPYLDFQNEINEEIMRQQEKANERIEEADERSRRIEETLNRELAQCRETNQRYQRHLDKMQADLGAVARQLMLVKWKEIDHARRLTEKEDDILTCDICGYSARRADYETKETECIFNGGHLTRYVCPQCDVIFGPSKFRDLGQDGINEDYWVHYLGFQEGDSTEKEIRAFKMLNPNKNSLYLNYGCGSWSKSIELLREEGYQVYGYEPYAADIDNPYIISGKENIQSMKFDGIFSNDLLEHLINPVEDLEFMKSLLLRPESKMAHSTGCFAYKHEITRFHTHFFVGRSADILAEKSGFRIVERCDDLEQNDFICCVFEMDDDKVNYLPMMYVSENGNMKDGKATLCAGAVCFGPYISLGKGKYRLNIDMEGEDVKAEFRCTGDMGAVCIYSCELNGNHNEVEVDLPQLYEKVEFTVKNIGDSEIAVKAVYMS